MTRLVKTTDGTVTAEYEYGPFGEVLRATGPMAKANPIRFSTQYTDDETDLVCYLHRYYNPSTGRWLSRDPIAEKGFRRVSMQRPRPRSLDWECDSVTFVHNDPLNNIDLLGLDTCCLCGPDVTSLVYQTLNDISQKYLEAPWYQKLLAQQAVMQPTGLSSWDIRYLFHWYDVNNPCKECRFTVTFEGKCVHANELNYIMWGYAILLTEAGDPDARVNELELGLQIRGMVVGEPLDVSGRKAGFAAYGAHLYPTLPDWLSWPAECNPNKDKFQGDASDWRWSGLKGGPY